MIILTEKDKARFWAKVDKTGDCWVWTSYKNAKGYGGFNVRDATARSSKGLTGATLSLPMRKFVKSGKGTPQEGLHKQP